MQGRSRKHRQLEAEDPEPAGQLHCAPHGVLSPALLQLFLHLLGLSLQHSLLVLQEPTLLWRDRNRRQRWKFLLKRCVSTDGPASLHKKTMNLTLYGHISSGFPHTAVHSHPLGTEESTSPQHGPLPCGIPSLGFQTPPSLHGEFFLQETYQSESVDGSEGSWVTGIAMKFMETSSFWP